MEFKCSLCNYSSPLKSNIKKHINNQKKCGKGVAEILEIPTEINCEYCDKLFTTKYSMIRHLKSCKVKKYSLEQELEHMKVENKKLQEKLAQAEAKVHSIPIINNTTNNTVNNNIIINITPYNDPNLDGVEKYYKEAVKKIFMSVPTIIERIHFNTDLPENHNICITNYRSKLAKVFTGTEWKTMDEDRLIGELVNTYENLLEDWAEDKPERMKYIERYKEIKERDGADKVKKILKMK